MSNLRVSIVLPFRDAASTLPECLDSIRAQTHRDWELVAVDDGSGDSSARVVRELDDPRVRLLSPGTVGLVAALNLGVRAARGALIARMDADDVMHPERLEAQVRFLEEHVDVDLVATQVELFSDSGMLAGSREYVRWQNGCVTEEEVGREIYVESPFAHPTVMMRRSFFERAGFYEEGEFPEDYDLWLRAHRAGLRMAKVPRPLLRWRDHERRLSRRGGRYAREAFDRLRAHYLATDARLRGREVVVWGSGRRTRQRVEPLTAHGVRVAAWIDIDPDKVDRDIAGVPVHAPSWLAGHEPRPFVLVYVASHGAREIITPQLEEMGYRNGADFVCVG